METDKNICSIVWVITENAITWSRRIFRMQNVRDEDVFRYPFILHRVMTSSSISAFISLVFSNKQIRIIEIVLSFMLLRMALEMRG